MPEYPDIMVYIEALERRILNQTLRSVQIRSPFLLRTVHPPVDTFAGHKVVAIERMGKRIVLGLAPAPAGHPGQQRWMVLHLMIAGRLHWRPPEKKTPGKNALLALLFDSGILFLTEAGTQKRASLHLFDERAALQALDPGGLEVLDSDFETFRQVFTASNHTLKRALTDPRILSGIGNAYSDEILHRARLSPIVLTQKLTAAELKRLFKAIQESLADWTQRLRQHYGDRFPEKVTAFRDDMAVHGRYQQPCPACQAPVQRIRYATNETNYCPRCQTNGRVLADRALSRLLKKDWPRTLDELDRV